MINVFMQETQSKDTEFLSDYRSYEEAIEYILTLLENDKYKGILGKYEYFTVDNTEYNEEEINPKSYLKPCPFCGGEAENDETTSPLIPKRYYVICHTCGTMSEWYSTAEEAAEAWNRRTEEKE